MSYLCQIYWIYTERHYIFSTKTRIAPNMLYPFIFSNINTGGNSNISSSMEYYSFHKYNIIMPLVINWHAQHFRPVILEATSDMQLSQLAPGAWDGPDQWDGEQLGHDQWGVSSSVREVAARRVSRSSSVTSDPRLSPAWGLYKDGWGVWVPRHQHHW